MGREITIYGTGKQVRDVLHVEELVRAVDWALKRSMSLNGDVYNIGGPNNALSLLEVIHYISGINKAKVSLKFGEWRKADQKVYISDIRKAKGKLGWEPKISWKEGMMRLYLWVFDNRQLFTRA